MIQGELAEHATERVDNVLIYICDSLRYDHLPDAIRELGVSGRAIATSTFTASGYPSILTGTYPSTHQVWTFEDTLAEHPILLKSPDHSGIDATHVWSNVDEPGQKPPLRICGETTDTTITEIDSPFVLVVHDRGGHMQYGRRSESDRWPSHSQFFDEFGRSLGEIRRLYREGVSESHSHLQAIMETLRHRGELENTLVVFTSDHGELLGEYGGLYGHGVPLVPELVTVPMVFAGAGLPRDERFEGVLSTVDIAPTVLAALGTAPSGCEGIDLWTRQLPQQRVARAEVWKETSYPLVKYRASSVWTDSGGHVRHLDSPLSRVLHLIGVQFYFASYANVVRRPSPGYLSLGKAYLGTSVNYGESVPDTLVDEHLVTDFFRRDGGEEPPKPDTEQLRELGYLE